MSFATRSPIQSPARVGTTTPTERSAISAPGRPRSWANTRSSSSGRIGRKSASSKPVRLAVRVDGLLKRGKFTPDTLGHIPRRRHYQDLARLDDETRKRSGGPQCSAFFDEKPGP